MTGPRRSSVGLLLVLLLSPRSVPACEVPLAVLEGRTFAETRRLLEGEVVFIADARLHDFEGRTGALSGVVKANGWRDAVGCVAIAVKSLDTGIGLRNRLMWENHLEAVTYPEIRFILTGVGDVRTEADRFEMMLDGDLVLHGVTRHLRIPARLRAADRDLVVEGNTVLRMSDYGITRPALLFIRVKDEVEVRFRVLVGAAE